MTHSRRPTGSKWIELAVAGTVLVMITSAAIPPQAPTTFHANEVAAISTLRAIAAAQQAFKSAVDIDTDCDGVGEYGYFAELAGRQPMRVGVGVPCAPAAGVAGVDELNPPLLRSRFGALNGSCVSHQGYLFQMWLPSASAGGVVAGIREDVTGGKAAAPFPDPDRGAQLWCCYAWPIRHNTTGGRAFFINQRGDVLQTRNQGAVPFAGFLCTPMFYDAFVVMGDMSSPVRLGTAGYNGNIWRLVQ